MEQRRWPFWRDCQGSSRWCIPRLGAGLFAKSLPMGRTHRFWLWAELDAAGYHPYLGDEKDWRASGTRELLESVLILRHALDYTMDTLPIVKRKDEERWDDYRTKRIIFEVYDAMQEAMNTGKPYHARFDPPPADPRCCHPPWQQEQTKG